MKYALLSQICDIRWPKIFEAQRPWLDTTSEREGVLRPAGQHHVYSHTCSDAWREFRVFAVKKKARTIDKDLQAQLLAQWPELGVTDRGLGMVYGMGEVEDFGSFQPQRLTPILAPFLFLFSSLVSPLMRWDSLLHMVDLPAPFGILHLL